MDNDFFVDLTSEQISDFSWRNFPDNVKIVFLTDTELYKFSWKGCPKTIEEIELLY